MRSDEMVKWVLGGIALYVAYQWYQSYVTAQAALAVSAPVAVISPDPMEGPMNLPGAPMSATIY